MRKYCLLFIVMMLLAVPTAASARYYMAMLCSDCAFGDRKKNCIKCGRYTFDRGVPARLCDSCGFGDRAKYCVKCGRYTFGRGAPAVLCSDHAFGDRKKYCIKCGRYTFD